MHLQGFVEINKELAAFSSFQNSGSTATLDIDATLVSTNKIDALFSYKGFKACQPLNTWWFEQGIVLHTEFRDGNGVVDQCPQENCNASDCSFRVG